MPFVEVFTREKLSDEIRTKLAEEFQHRNDRRARRPCRGREDARLDVVPTMARRFQRFFNSSITSALTSRSRGALK
jgi:hypothetical protein